MESRARRPDWSAPRDHRRGELDKRLHLWLFDPDAVPDAELRDTSAGLLSQDEARRWKRYVRHEDRHLSLVAHVLVRRVLSLYAHVNAGEWTFVTNEHGRPEIDATQQYAIALRPGPALRFNLSHTSGMVALLVHDQTDAGVDVECIGRVEDPRAIAATVFSHHERAALHGVGPDELDARFYRLWTLKEAFIKAKGMGLAIPLKDFWFSIGDPLSIRVDCCPNVDPDPAGWRFSLVQPSTTHIVAVARAVSGRTLDVFTPAPAELLDPS